MEKPKGRGRARGRARQTTDEQRRPGEERGGEAAAPAAVYPQQGDAGRRTHRGAPRVDPIEEKRPLPTQMEGVIQAVAGASISDPYPQGRGRSHPSTFAEASIPDPYPHGRGRSHPSTSAEARGAPSRRVGSIDERTRPTHLTNKQGTSGNPTTLLANYFELLSKPTWCVYQYHCDFSPVVESSRMRRVFIREHRERLGHCYLFDGMSDLKTSKFLEESDLELFSRRITDGETIRITLKRVAELSPSHPELQRLFNTQMRRNLSHMQFQLLGRFFFDPAAVSEVEQYSLQIWQGCTTSIRQHEEKVMMCVDTVHKVVRKETALNLIRSLAKNFRGESYQQECLKELVGNVVMTRYNNRTYRIEDIDWTLNPSKTFETREGSITYFDYYKKQYDLIIKDMGQPLLLCTSKEKEIRRGASVSKKIYLIPEVCLMTGLTDAMRTNFQTMKEIANHTRVNPAKRVDNLMHFINRLNSNTNVRDEMAAWGLHFKTELVEIPARILAPETIILGNTKKQVPPEKDFTVQIRSDPMVNAIELGNWMVIYTSRDKDKTNEMLGVLNTVARKLGMRMNRPTMCEIRDDRINTYMNAVKETFNPQNTQMIMFILPNNKKERYDALKKFTCVDNAVPSQCVLSKTISKPKSLMTVATKVAIQLNCKLGGVPWSLAIPIASTKFMICGYDTYHDSSRKGQSAGAFVASLDPHCNKWYSKVNFHSAGGWEELSNHLTMNFTMALKKYHSVNSCLPELFIVYRDGVGDGQIRYVKEFEMRQIANVLNEKMMGKPIRLAYIIVNKKISTRFFRPQGRNITNPPHGTVVDSVVTRFDRYDFFLVSQLATQGTVSPTMYNVIEDSSGLKPEHIQRLTYKLTHLYYNCSGTISVPAPCQYAHKLAFLAGQSLHQQPQESLCDKLFYL